MGTSSPSRATVDVKVKKIVNSIGQKASPIKGIKKEAGEEPKPKMKSPRQRILKEEFVTNSKKSVDKGKATLEEPTEMNWDVSEGEEVNRPVEDDPGTKKEKERSSSEAGQYDNLFFCYECRSIFVTKKALDEHQQKGHDD